MGDNLEFAGHECIGGQVRIQHMRELEADAFACHCLAMHAIQFSGENTRGGITVNPQSINDAAALALAAVYIFYINQIIANARHYPDLTVNILPPLNP